MPAWLQLKEIPDNLFRNISGPAMVGMFVNTFSNTGLAISGPSAKIDGKYLYEIWPDATAEQVGVLWWNVCATIRFDRLRGYSVSLEIKIAPFVAFFLSTSGAGLLFVFCYLWGYCNIKKQKNTKNA
jgi:hypothetical protein